MDTLRRGFCTSVHSLCLEQTKEGEAPVVVRLKRSEGVVGKMARFGQKPTVWVNEARLEHTQ